MLKHLNWTAKEAAAREMTSEALAFSRQDCFDTAALWDHGDDPDGNSGYYRDEGSVYAREQVKRSKLIALVHAGRI